MLESTQTAGAPDALAVSISPAVPASATVTFTASAPPSGPPVRHRRVGIVGFGQTATLTPVADPDVELIGMNGFWRVTKSDFGLDIPEERWSLWLDMHSIGFTRQYGERAGIGDKQERWLEQPHPFPILSVETNPAWPSVQPYPLEEVIQFFGRDYFTSSVAYAIAFAAYQDDVAEISLWGIDLIDDTEYSDQRPCAEYWIGRAEALGIKIVVPDKSALLKQRCRYGYDDQSSPLLRELQEGLTNQIAQLRKIQAERHEQFEQLRTQMQVDDGAVQQAQMLLSRLSKWERGGRI